MLRAPVERVPEVPPAVKPVPVHEVAFVDDHVRVDDCPWSMVEGLAEMETVGVNVLHDGGLFAPFEHGSYVLHVGGLFAPFEHV